MPYKSEVSDYDITNKTNLYLYDNLTYKVDEVVTRVDGVNYVNGILGYWILDSSDMASFAALHIRFDGYVGSYFVSNSVDRGVRPVINLKL